MSHRLLCFGLLVLYTGCSSGSDYGTAAGVNGSTHRATVNGGQLGITTSASSSSNSSGSSTGVASSTSSGAGASSGGVSSGGSTGGSTSGCAQADVYSHPLTDCDAGQNEVLGQLVNFCSPQQAPVTLSGTFSDAYNGALVATNLSCGLFYFCLSPGESVTPSITIDGFYPTLLPTVTPDGGSTFYNAVPGIDMLCNQGDAQPFDQLTNPTYMASLASVLVEVEPDTEATDPCITMAGWVFTLALPDAGQLSAATAYVASFGGFDPTATATGEEGAALIYNLQPGLNVQLIGSNPSVLDAGADCVSFNAQFAMSLNLPLASGALTYVPYSEGDSQ